MFPKPKFLSWEESATLMLNGPTAYKQLTHWAPNTVKPGDAVPHLGRGRWPGLYVDPVDPRARGCRWPWCPVQKGAATPANSAPWGYLLRTDYPHLGRLPDLNSDAHSAWTKSFASFRRDFFMTLGKRSCPRW